MKKQVGITPHFSEIFKGSAVPDDKEIATTPNHNALKINGQILDFNMSNL